MNYRTQLMTSAMSRATWSPDEPASAPAADPAPAEPNTDEPPADPAPPAEEPAGEDDKPVDLKTKEPTLLGDKEEPAKDEPAAPVPEAYEFKLEEGEVDAALVEAATPIFKDLGLSNDAAQKVVDLYYKDVLPGVAQTIQTNTLALLGMADIGQWADQTKADKEIGGAKLDETLARAAQARDTFATPALKELLTNTRLGNHPEVIRLFAKIGEAVGEGAVHNADTGVTQRSAAQTLYGEEFQPKS